MIRVPSSADDPKADTMPVHTTSARKLVIFYLDVVGEIPSNIS